MAWISPDEVLSIADDGKILKWNLVNGETKDFADLNNDFHPTDIHWYPRASGGGGGGGSSGGGGKKMQASSSAGANDVFLVTSAEGKLQLMSGKNGRVEKSVDAHRGACLSARFVYVTMS